MKLSIILAVPLLVASASAFAYPVNGNDKGKGKVVEAPLDPKKAPQTIQNAQDHVNQHGKDGMTVKVSDLNSQKEADSLRNKAIGGQKEKGKVIDEEPPAKFRKEGDPVTTKATDKPEGNHQGGVLSVATQKAKKEGPETEIKQTVKGKGEFTPTTPTTPTGNKGGPPADSTRSKKTLPRRAVLYTRMAEAKAEAEAYAEAYAEAVAELDALTLHARALDEREIVNRRRKRAAQPEVYTFQERSAEPYQYYTRDVEPSVNNFFARGLMPESHSFVY